MVERTAENNTVTISGEIVSDFTFSHEVFGEGFYSSFLSVKRKSEVADIIPIMVSERLVNLKTARVGRNVKINGQFRSYNKYKEGRRSLVLSVFAREFEELETLPFTDEENKIYLDGYICKEPVYRETPFGREISDIIIAVNRQYGKCDYIPCICWGRNARFAGSLDVGTHIRINGRIQSREYRKKVSDGEFETRTAYEVSVFRIEIVENQLDDTVETEES